MQDSKNKMAAVKVAGKISAGLVFRVCYTVRVPTTNCHSGKSEHRNVGASERNLNPNPPLLLWSTGAGNPRITY